MKKRHFINRIELSKQIAFNPNSGLRHSIIREPSVVDEFYMEECQPSDDSMKSYSCVDPIIVLFNQERLNGMGATAAKTFLDSLVPKSNELAELRQKCSDEDLMSMMKSRHLQAPCEILAWCRYMQSNIDTFNSEVAKLVAQREVESSQTTAADASETNVE